MTSKAPAAIQTLIDAHINGFNTQDNDLFLGVFGGTAIIIVMLQWISAAVLCGVLFYLIERIEA